MDLNDREDDQFGQNSSQKEFKNLNYGNDQLSYHQAAQDSGFYQGQEFIQEQPQLNEQVEEDFVLMDVIGGGCSAQIGTNGTFTNAAKSVAVHHPTKPIVAYSAGCMIIVYDLMNDSKVNLMGHRHNVYALAFTPNGNSLLSVDFNRDAEIYNSQIAVEDGEQYGEPSSNLFMWDWQRGLCVHSTPIPRASSIAQALISNQNEQSYRSHLAQPSESVREYGNQESKASHACYVQICFDKSGSLFLILESTPIDIGGGYRVTIWSFNKQSQMEMVSSLDLELQSPAIDIGFLPRSQSDILQAQRSAGQNNHSAQVFLHTKFQFYTAERNCIKIWEYWQGNPILKKRIHIKQLICQVIISEITNFFIILGEIGKLLILDSQGEFVSTLAQEGIVFSKVGQANDKIFLGTTRGTVQIYHLASLAFISEIPYQLSFMEKFSLNSANRNRQQLDVLSLQKVGPPVVETGITQNLRYLWIRYSDGSFAMIDRSIQNPRQAILGFSAGHFENISGMQWIKSRSALDTFSHIGSFVNKQAIGNEFGNDKTIPVSYQEQEDLQFMTVSHDLSVHVWRHYGDRWAFSYIDIAKSFDQSLSFQRKQCDRSTRDMKLTAICLYPRSNNLVVGDNRGYVRVYQLVNENAHIIATHRLARSAELELEEKLGINTLNDQRTPILFANSQQQYEAIKEIYITKNEQVAVITFESGCISIYDTKNGYSLIGEINDQEFSKFNTQYNDLKSLSIQARIIENTNHLSANQFNIYNKQTYGQDEMPGFQIYPASHSALYEEGNLSTLSANRQGFNLPTISSNRFLGNHIGNSLKVLSLGAPNQVSLQLVDIKGGAGNLTRSKLSQFVISEGKVNGFDVHPSGDYILITSSKGRIFVFRVDTGELRGTIQVPMNCTGCLIDPSGLYVCIKVPAYTHQNTYNLIYDQKEQQERLGLFTSSQRDFERNTILVYEIGRGLPAAEIAQVFDISTMSFSPDGKYLSLGSTNGAVSVWSMSNALHQNVKQVLEGIKLQPDFWFNYPIFLPDFEQYNNEQNYLNQKGQNLITIQENTRDYTTRSNQPQISPLPPQRLRQESQQPTTQTRYEQFTPQPQQFNQYQKQTIPQQVPQQQNQFQNFQNLNNPNFQEQLQQKLKNQSLSQLNMPSQQRNIQPPTQKARPQSSQRMTIQPKPVTHISNEQRFIRNSFVNKNQLNLAEAPIQNYQQEQQKMREQQQNQDYLEFQKKQQQPQQQWQQTTSFGVNQSLTNRQFESIDPNKLTNQQIQSASFIPPSYKPVNQSVQKKSFTQNEAVATLLANSYEQPNQFENQQKYAPNNSAPNGFFNPQMNNNQLQNYNNPGFQEQQANNYLQQQLPNSNNQQQAANPFFQGMQATQSYKDPRFRNQSNNFGNKDETIPVNHSELLYNRPLNQSKYADVVSHDIVNMQNRYQMTFDGSLNDRELTGTGYSQPNNMLQRKNSFADLNRRTQVDYFQPKKLEQQQFQDQILKTNADVISNRGSLKKKNDSLVQDDLFKPKEFTNLKTQQDILRSSFQVNGAYSPLKAGLRPDPEDIDGDQKNHQVKSQELTSETEHMLQELDGLNKYLKGVKVPTQLRQNETNVQPMTIQKFKNEDSDKNRRNFIEQSSNYSLTDEVYQNIEDFERKLNLS